MGQEETNKEIGARLTLTRRALGYDRQTEFVEALNAVFSVSPQRWNNYETGRERIAVPVALALCDRFGLSFDWIFRAKRGGLPARVLRAIKDTEALDFRLRKYAFGDVLVK
jgi:hypothetical protein